MSKVKYFGMWYGNMFMSDKVARIWEWSWCILIHKVFPHFGVGIGRPQGPMLISRNVNRANKPGQC